MTGKSNRKNLRKRIAGAETRLYEKLDGLDLTSSGISEYNQRYLSGKIDNLKSELQLYGRLLFLALDNSTVAPDDFTAVDYGGGSGIISFLAAELGIGTIIYNDIYNVSCSDVARLSELLDLKLDHIVCGDVDEVISHLNENNIIINAIVSYDVLEHLYDVGSHFRKLSNWSQSDFRIVYGSGANMANPRYLKFVTNEQINAELKNKEKKWGHKERDTLQSYLEARKDIILAYATDISPEHVNQLASSTRGLIKDDIEKCVDEFRREGSITYRMDHPTNTCDPYTGNWCEHLMKREWLKKITKKEGFSIVIMTGRYNTYGSLAKRSIKALLNVLLTIIGSSGMFLAPYYVLYSESENKTHHI